MQIKREVKAIQIHPRELRIGNILNCQASEEYILPIILDWRHLKWISEDPKGFNSDHSPIPITEEWLIKLGFKEDVKKSKLSYNGVSITLFKGVGYYLNIENCIPFNNPIKYIHQLQNLYFALMGEELKLNE